MASRRLIPADVVAGWEDKLRAAVEAALEAQLAGVRRTLLSHGLSANLVAASRAKKAAGAALGAVVVHNVWSSSAWSRNVDEFLAPVAAAVALDAVDAASANSGGAMWGGSTSEKLIASTIVGQALASGAAIGARADAAGIADDDAATGISTSLASAGDILGNLMGGLSNMAATMSSNDVALAVTALGAPAYLSATKSWNNVGDDKVRDSHQGVADVSINEYFDVGGGMLGPGDPQGPDEETINCRCWLEYDGVVPESDDGSAPVSANYSGLGEAFDPDAMPEMEGEGA